MSRATDSNSSKVPDERHVARAPVVLGMGTALPPFDCPQNQALAYYESLLPAGPARERLVSLFQHSGVEHRYLPRPPVEYLTPRGFGARNRRYQEDGLALAAQAARGCIERAGISAQEITHVVFVTTTGLATPSLDAALVDTVGLASSVERLPLFGLGCAGGAAGLARAAGLVRGLPAGVVLLVSVELCSHTFDTNDKSVLGIIAASLFGDGAAAALVAGSGVPVPAGRPGARIIDWASRLFPRTGRVMGWDFEDEGFKLVLDRELPAVVAREVRAPVEELLGRHGLHLSDVRFLAFHPGGPKVVDALEDGLSLARGTLTLSRRVLAKVGNLSSAAVLHVLADVLESGGPRVGDYALVLAPGPGFALEQVLIRFDA